jgi:outer membrane protein W
MKSTRMFSLLAGSLVALAVISVRAHAATGESEWGDLGYSNPSSSTPEVEEIPMALADAPAPEAKTRVENDNDEIATTISSAELLEAEPAAAKVEEVEIKPAPAASKRRNITDISTVQNTYGVETEERQSISIYAAPFAGMTSVIGNDTADSAPQYTVGGSVGLLISNNMLVEASYARAETNFSNPRVNSTQGVFLMGNTNVFTLKQDIISGGARLFVLGRESRIRPFLGGGISYARGSLNYTTAYAAAVGNQSQFTNDLTLSQYQGFGEIGAEVAITRNIVASASFQLSGVLSSSTSGSDAATANNYDPSRLDVGNSVSRTASYMIAGGVGIYF